MEKKIILKLKNDKNRIQALTVDYKGAYVALDNKVYATFEFACDKDFFKNGFEGYFPQDKEDCNEIIAEIEKAQERVDKEKQELNKRLKNNNSENLVDFFNYLKDNNLVLDFLNTDHVLKAYLDDKETNKEVE